MSEDTNRPEPADEGEGGGPPADQPTGAPASEPALPPEPTAPPLPPENAPAVPMPPVAPPLMPPPDPSSPAAATPETPITQGPTDSPFAPPSAQSGPPVAGAGQSIPPVGPPPGTAVGPDPGIIPPAPPPGSLNYVPAPGYGTGYATGQQAKNDGMSLASLILGISSVLLAFCGGIGFITGVLAIIFSVMGKKNIARDGTNGGGMATAGLILGIVGCAIAAIVFFFWIIASIASGPNTYRY